MARLLYAEKVLKPINGKRALRACIVSPHPMVLTEFSRVLEGPDFQIVTHQLETMLGPELRKIALPRALVYVLDAHTSQPATSALIANILENSPVARILLLAEKFTQAESNHLLRLGAKGLLTFADARDQLSRALPLVASGGFWVPRAMLSEFVDSILSNSQGRRLKVETGTQLSPREQEVLEQLLDNLANKEIANKFNISERTVKFHVSNLLSKFGVRRRADLILLCYQRRQANQPAQLTA